MPLLLNLFPNIFLTVRGVTSVVLFLNTSILLLMFLSVCPYIHAFIFVLNCFLIRKKKQKAHLVRHIIPYDICVTSWWWNFELKGHLDQAHTVSLTFSLTEWNFLMTVSFSCCCLHKELFYTQFLRHKGMILSCQVSIINCCKLFV